MGYGCRAIISLPPLTGVLVLLGLVIRPVPAGAQPATQAGRQYRSTISVPATPSTTPPAASDKATSDKSVIGLHNAADTAAGAPLEKIPLRSTTPATASSALAGTGTPVLKGLGGSGLSSTVKKMNPRMMAALKQFEVAKAAFPNFCQDWQHKLDQRERDNLAHINWKLREGLETGTFVGYSKINSCVCKQASNGIPIGELTYRELDYELTGKTVDDAKHSTPRTMTIQPTREIFSWDHGKWFY